MFIIHGIYTDGKYNFIEEACGKRCIWRRKILSSSNDFIPTTSALSEIINVRWGICIYYMCIKLLNVLVNLNYCAT